MSAKIVRFEAPERVDAGAARFAMAEGLIFQGGGAIAVVEAARRLAGMEQGVFVRAASALGPEMEEMIEQAFDMEAYREAKAEDGESVPRDKTCAMLDRERQEPARAFMRLSFRAKRSAPPRLTTAPRSSARESTPRRKPL